MKYLKNVQLKGRNAVELELAENRPLTVFSLARISVLGGPEKPTVDGWTKFSAILDRLDEQLKEKADKDLPDAISEPDYIDFGDSQWDIVRPGMEKFIMITYGIHLRELNKHIDMLVETGCPDTKKTARQIALEK